MPERKVLLTEKKGREGELLPIQRIVAEEEAREDDPDAGDAIVLLHEI